MKADASTTARHVAAWWDRNDPIELTYTCSEVMRVIIVRREGDSAVFEIYLGSEDEPVVYTCEHASSIGIATILGLLDGADLPDARILEFAEDQSQNMTNWLLGAGRERVWAYAEQPRVAEEGTW